MSGCFQGDFLFFYFDRVHVSRCGDVYNNNNNVQFDHFCIIFNAMFRFVLLFQTCALLCDFGLTTIQ